jgi:nucleoside-diphosphate-sugar epimerase
MICLVTGAAGFIGSHLCRRLVKDGHSVTGVDCFADFYPRSMKEKNIESLLQEPRFRLVAEDLDRLDLREILQGQQVVFHLAAQAGVRSSWGQNFSIYTRNNIQVTQKLLEAAREVTPQRIVYASTSSVYGLTTVLPMAETAPLHPVSPYGVTKLAAEQLCFLYHANFGLPSVSLRFFTVYGPGQRPDMAFHRFFKAIGEDREIPVFGDGRQTRDFTYIDDIVEANIAAMKLGRPGETYNIGGGQRETLNDLFPLLEDITSRKVRIVRAERQKGDMADTFADISKARRELGYASRTPLEQGLRAEWDWIREIYGF